MWETLKNWAVNQGADWAGRVLYAAILALVGIVICRVILKIVNKTLAKSKLEKAAHSLIRTVIKIVMYVLVALIVASALSIDVTGVVALASVATLAISLALQNMLSNVIGGFTLLSTHPFGSGDFVEIAGQSGTVQEVGIAYTQLTTPDNKLVYIPNSAVVEAEIVNYSDTGTRRVEVSVTASYSAKVEEVEKALRDAADVEGVLPEPATFVSMTEYGDSAIRYVIRVWTKTEDYWTVHFAILHRIKEIFDARGIEMTYPHLNVHLDK